MKSDRRSFFVSMVAVLVTLLTPWKSVRAEGSIRRTSIRRFRGIASLPVVDLHGDVVEFGSLDLTEYRKHPVLSLNFDRRLLPVGRVTHIEWIDGALVVDGEVHASESQVPSTWRPHLAVGFTTTTRVERQGTIVHRAGVLTEIALTPAPSCPTPPLEWLD
jgi:hypothetical protein